MRLLLFLLMFASASSFSLAGTGCMLQFRLLSGNKVIVYGNASAALKNGDTVQVEDWRMYISRIRFSYKGNNVWQEANSYHLVDLEDTASWVLPLDVPAYLSFDKVTFQLGIDSSTNVSGALGGDLDPAKGMYWTWQSGYINFKLEGSSRYCPARDRQFQFHLGGYHYPFSALQEIELDIAPASHIIIGADIRKLLESIDFSKQQHIMSPGKAALDMSEKVAGIFRVLQL